MRERVARRLPEIQVLRLHRRLDRGAHVSPAGAYLPERHSGHAPHQDRVVPREGLEQRVDDRARLASKVPQAGERR